MNKKNGSELLKIGDEILRELSGLSLDLAQAYLTKDNISKLIAKLFHFYIKYGASSKTPDEFGMDHSLIKGIRPYFAFLYRYYWRVKVTGIENVPKIGPALIVGNHSGTLPYDSAMLHMAVWECHPKKRMLRFLVENFAYDMGPLGRLMNRIGGVRASPDNAKRLLARNELVAVFPEGVKGIGKLYKDRYRLLPLGRGGFVKLAIEAKVPIVPVAIIGAEEIYPIIWKTITLAKPLGLPYLPITYTWPHLGPLGLIPLPSKWVIAFGKPVDLRRYSKRDAENNDLIQEISATFRKKLQKMIDEGLKKRGDPWL